MIRFVCSLPSLALTMVLTVTPLAATVLTQMALPSACFAQQQSVRPGINQAFQNPDVDAYVERFEIESREVFAQRNKIVEACRIQPGQTVADIGAGTGLFTRLFSRAVGSKGEVFAVDISKNFLTHIEKTSREQNLPNIRTLLADAETSNLPANSVDVAFICDTYHHFEFPQKTLASIRQALKPEGRLIVIDFHRIPGKSSEWTMEHVRAGQEVFESEIVQAGFQKTREVEDLLEDNYFVEFVASSAPGLQTSQRPLIQAAGDVVPVKDGVAEPQAGAKVVFDVTVDEPGKVNKGLDRAARLINLYAQAGRSASDVQVAVVLHGAATRAATTDAFYAQRFASDANPSLPLIRELRAQGVEVIVCGQALNYNGFPRSVVADDLQVATAALTAIINRQAKGYAYLPIH